MVRGRGAGAPRWSSTRQVGAALKEATCKRHLRLPCGLPPGSPPARRHRRANRPYRRRQLGKDRAFADHKQPRGETQVPKRSVTRRPQPYHRDANTRLLFTKKR